MAGSTRSVKCPKCGGSEIHRSHRHRRDYLLNPFRIMRMLRPYRCRQCLHRFWRPSTVRNRFLMTYAVIVVVCLLAAWGFFSISDNSTGISTTIFKSVTSQELDNIVKQGGAAGETSE